MAMTLVFGVLLALLGALGSAANGITNGRQRTVATSLGKQAIETLQGSSYADVAMNLTSSGLSTDPRITGTGATRTFEGELLVGGGSVPYSTTSVMSGITYVLRTYVTEVTPAAGFVVPPRNDLRRMDAVHLRFLPPAPLLVARVPARLPLLPGRERSGGGRRRIRLDHRQRRQATRSRSSTCRCRRLARPRLRRRFAPRTEPLPE